MSANALRYGEKWGPIRQVLSNPGAGRNVAFQAGRTGSISNTGLTVTQCNSSVRETIVAQLYFAVAQREFTLIKGCRNYFPVNDEPFKEANEIAEIVEKKYSSTAYQ